MNSFIQDSAIDLSLDLQQHYAHLLLRTSPSRLFSTSPIYHHLITPSRWPTYIVFSLLSTVLQMMCPLTSWIVPEDDVVESDGVDDEAPLEVVLEHIMSDKTYVPEGYIMGTDGSLIVDGAADKHCDMISPSDSEGIEEASRGKRRRIANTQYGEYDAH
ncbi:hypothetical protein F4604DRAFT_1686447 [Suillus subluteus]|nr:hypothetical protein F4604DRAFT_1686447 [Suillus subluteus]